MEQKITTFKGAFMTAEHKAPAKKKKYYKVDEVVRIKATNETGVVKALDVRPTDNVYKATVELTNEAGSYMKVFDLWEIDKVKVTKGGKKTFTKEDKRDKLYFAKVRPDAVIPSKTKENAGYDIYANFAEEELHVPQGKVTLIPTGIASYMDSKYYLDVRHERGSTSKHGMALLAGVVDSTYQGEIFLAMSPTDRDILISKKYTDVVVLEEYIIYPYSKAIAQATLQIVPNVQVAEISYEELKSKPSARGAGKLGASGK